MKVYENLSAADSFSMLNALFGISSIFMLFLSHPKIAFLFILLAVLADGMDGMMARKYGSRMAVIDEFADMVSFVASPAAMAFRAYGIVLLPFLYAYVIASIIHLLNYHYSDKKFFLGLPTPAAAILIGASALIMPIWYAIFITAILSVLVTIPLKYVRIEGMARVMSAFIIIVTIIMIWNDFFILLLFLLTHLYLIMGSVKVYLAR